MDRTIAIKEVKVIQGSLVSQIDIIFMDQVQKYEKIKSCNEELADACEEERQEWLELRKA